MLMGAQMGPLAPGFKNYPTPLMMFVMLLFASLCLRVSYGEADNSSAAAAAALIKFKHSLSYTKALDTWNDNPKNNPCSGEYGRWYGVLCFNDSPWGLQLENLGLSGNIDVDSLVPLRALRTISLKNNSFGGQMPDWRKLGALKSLFLSNNHFSGRIRDDAFEGMGSLKKIDLANNNFIGTIPLSLSAAPLVELRLENNGFTGLIPNFKPSLAHLNLSNNQLEGPIPPSLSKMDLTSFQGNKELCGKPLNSPCASEGPLPDQSPSPSGSPTQSTSTTTPDHDTTDSDTAWTKTSLPVKIIIIVMSVLVALAAVILLLAIFRRSRKETETPRLGHVPSSSHNISAKDVSLGPEAGGLTRTISNPKKTSSEAASHNKLSFVRNDRQRFDLQDLLRASAEVLGSGNLGSSYKAILMDGQAVVVKRFKQMNNVGKEEFHEHMRRLGRLVHPNLLPLVAYYYRKEEKLLVFEYLQNGSLATRLHGKRSMEQPALDWPTRLRIVKGVANALAYLHSELATLSLPHGHLKASNVVLDNNLQPLLTDYALAPVVNLDQLEHLLVAYKSPEYTLHRRTTRKTDVWNLGVLILEILTGKIPTTYLPQGPGYGYNISTWVNSFATEDVFDPEMEYPEGSEGEIRRLLEVGVGCCEEDLDKRWDLRDAIKKIEEVKETAAYGDH